MTLKDKITFKSEKIKVTESDTGLNIDYGDIFKLVMAPDSEFLEPVYMNELYTPESIEILIEKCLQHITENPGGGK